MSKRTFLYGSQRVVVDRSQQVIRADLDDAGDFEEWRRTRAPASEAPRPVESKEIEVISVPRQYAAPIHPSVSRAGVDATFTPLFALIAKAKKFDDRFYAALETVLHDGAGEHPGLHELLDAIRVRLPTGTPARGLLDAAKHLAGAELPEEGQARLRARKWLAGFLPDAKKSRPIGFYAESEELQRIFRHDRLLQSELEPDDANALADLIDLAPDLRQRYRDHLRIVETLTGPRALASVEDRFAARRALIPPSESAEGRVVKELFGGRSVPPDFHLGRELVERIRGGRLATTPRSGDGWYAHQFHAIAALLSPDTEGLEIGPRYRQELVETFLALFALNRETHAKQLESPAAGGRPLVIAPELTLEPLPELYARIASAYRFVRGALAALLGEEVLRGVELERDGIDLFDGIVQMETLFLGAEATARAELGRPMADRDAARACFRAWQLGSANDPDVNHDLRVAVPLWFDVERKTVRIAATLGLETRTLKLEWIVRPKVEVLGESRLPWPTVPQFDEAHRTILSPLTIECDVREPPSRDELRAICDREHHPDAVRSALEAR